MTSAVPETPALALDLDEKVLTRLFDLAGPEQTIEILDRLLADLGVIVKAMQGAAKGAKPGLRRQNHALIGIAGTVGALGLHRKAMEMGRVLREAGESGADAKALAALIAGTEALIARLAAMRAERG